LPGIARCARAGVVDSVGVARGYIYGEWKEGRRRTVGGGGGNVRALAFYLSVVLISRKKGAGASSGGWLVSFLHHRPVGLRNPDPAGAFMKALTCSVVAIGRRSPESPSMHGVAETRSIGYGAPAGPGLLHAACWTRGARRGCAEEEGSGGARDGAGGAHGF